MLTKTQFTTLTLIESSATKLTQREISEKTELALGTINKALTSLTDANFISNMQITQEGINALEPYRVKRAIFLAAGFGSRMVPITLNTPKPLVIVHGKRIIETLLDAVIAAGIEEIIIVRGYLSEQFDILLKKYPSIKFVENKHYNVANNISSVMLVKDLLGASYVLEADLVLYNPKLISKYQYCSNYLGVEVAQTNDWCFKVRRGKISKLCVGGTNCFHMFGLSYFTLADGKKLEKNVEDVYNMPGGKERYWDQVALEHYIDNYSIEVRSCSFNDIVEIDSFAELKSIDKIYDC